MARLLAPSLAALAVACSVFGSAQQLTVGWKAGQIYSYSVHVTVDGTLTAAGQSTPVRSDQRVQETLEVTALDRGVATVAVTVSPPAGASTQAPLQYSFQVARDGKVVGGGQSGASPALPTIPGADQVTPVLADKPVRPGDTWSLSYSRPNPLAGGELKQQLNGRYVRDEQLGTVNTAVIENKLTGRFDFSLDISRLAGTPAAGSLPTTGQAGYQGDSSSTATFWLEKSTGRIVKMTRQGRYSIAYDFSKVGTPGGGLGLSKLEFDGSVTEDMSPA
jgi:hypothetical protein